MRIYVLPVSGGSFPLQLAYISELSKIDVKPDLVLGSSGGNVAAYISMAADWQNDNIINITKLLTCDLFSSSWWPYYLQMIPSWFIGYFKGSVYASGQGTPELFKKIFDVEKITKTEIWTSVLNRNYGKGQLFCNKKESDSIIKSSIENSEELLRFRDCLPLSYMDGDIEKIAKITLASASIPVFVPEQIINGERYVDGGAVFSSPLMPLQDHIIELSEKCHIDYMSSYDMDVPKESIYKSIYDLCNLTMHELLKSICISDRLAAIELIKNNSKQLNYSIFDGTIENLQLIEKIRKQCNRSLLEFYPIHTLSIDLTSFTSDDINKMIEQSKNNYKMRFWWNSETEYDSSISNIKILRFPSSTNLNKSTYL